MSLEDKVHSVLMNKPFIKRIVKRTYQVGSVALSRPKKSDGNIMRVTPDDGYEYLFGYYDKSPWDASGRYMLSLRVKNASKNVAPGDEAELVLIDTENNNSVKVIAKTCTWNIQQGCMAGWLGPKFDEEIIYNDLRNGKYRGVILNIKTGKERLLEMPVYSVSNDGKMALSLDFSRLHRLRPGYGYSNLEDKTANEKIPDGACVWKIDVKSGKTKPILTYKDLYDFEHQTSMENAEHKVNHLMIGPDGKRFMVIHRWLNGGDKTSRLLTCDIDGKNLYNLADEKMVSHCFWKNDKEILAYCRRGGKNGYYLLKDKTKEYGQKWDWITADGHPSYSPNGKLVATDTYPNRKRICVLRVMSDTVSTIIARVYAPFKYDNDTRCDLHPRWSRDGKKICFDGCFEGKREVYVVNIPEKVLEVTGLAKKPESKTKIIYLMTSCRKAGPTEQTLNIIKNLDRKVFDPILVTIYEEGIDSRINDYLPYVSNHYTVLMGKKRIIMKKNDKMRQFLLEEKPNMIHSVGVFPNYLISTIGFKNHLFTLRNYAYEDYPAKFGKIRGELLAKLQISAIKDTKTVVSCSKSLQKMYKDKLNIKTLCIQNGVDVKKYTPLNQEQKLRLRKKMGFKKEDFIWIYSGQFIERKNIPFTIDGFLEACDKNDRLVLLGNGADYEQIKDRYDENENVTFMGAVDNMSECLGIGDAYVSASRSEGLPNGVLEAMAMKLPVLLSDISQHKELALDGKECGVMFFKLDDKNNYVNQLKKMRAMDTSRMGKDARNNVEKCFSDVAMSGKYQEEYSKIMKRGLG